MLLDYEVRYPNAKIDKSQGTTPSESNLWRLCSHTFLDIWSYPNPYKKQSCGKELCDLLVVFENHIVIFSDKLCEFSEQGDVVTNWIRWYKKAILKSANQLLGARQWICNSPSRICLDAKCEHDFPLKLDINERTRFHLIAVAHGAKKACQNYFKSGDGGLILDNQVSTHQHYTKEVAIPFRIGKIAGENDYIHVFDDASLANVLSELDTITDFLRYLDAKEQLMLSDKFVSAAGENELLSIFLQNSIFKRYSAFSSFLENDCDAVTITEGHWEDFRQSEMYTQWKDWISKSYFLDAILRKTFYFIEHGQCQHMSHESLNVQSELFCNLAAEDRIGRRILSDGILSFLNSTPTDFRGTRIIQSTCRPFVYYLVLLLPKLEDQTEEDYRKLRRNMLEDYCFILKRTMRNAKQVVGIAHDTLGGANDSEDFICINLEPWTEQDESRAERLENEFISEGLLGKRNIAHKKEYPPYFRQPHVKGCERNKPCPCGSGIKYKKCCGSNK